MKSLVMGAKRPVRVWWYFGCHLQPCEKVGIGATDSKIGFLPIAFINGAL